MRFSPAGRSGIYKQEWGLASSVRLNRANIQDDSDDDVEDGEEEEMDEKEEGKEEDSDDRGVYLTNESPSIWQDKG